MSVALDPSPGIFSQQVIRSAPFNRFQSRSGIADFVFSIFCSRSKCFEISLVCEILPFDVFRETLWNLWKSSLRDSNRLWSQVIDINIAHESNMICLSCSGNNIPDVLRIRS